MPVRAAEHARDGGAVADVDAVGDLAAGHDPLELVGQRHRRPHPARFVESDAVRRPVEPIGEDPASDNPPSASMS